LKKTLYIVSEAPRQEAVPLLPSRSELRDTASVVLIHDGVKHQRLPFSRVFALSDDVMSRNLVSPFRSVSYQELIRMIFEADNVAVM
jgi:sulfur transfer complex TusBCD TusB component (DsrH family)